MTVWTPPVDLIVTAYWDLLRGTDLTVFDGAYDGDPNSPPYPYGIGYSPAGGSADPMPDLDDDSRDIELPLLVTAVSDYRNECQRAGQTFRDRLLARAPNGAFLHPVAMPDGWQETDRRPDLALPGVDRTGSPPNAIYMQPARYLVRISPTPGGPP